MLPLAERELLHFSSTSRYGKGVWGGVLTEEVAIFSAAMYAPVECDGEDVKKAVDAYV